MRTYTGPSLLQVHHRSTAGASLLLMQEPLCLQGNYKTLMSLGKLSLLSIFIRAEPRASQKCRVFSYAVKINYPFLSKEKQPRLVFMHL